MFGLAREGTDHRQEESMESKSLLASLAAFCALVGMIVAPAFAQERKRAAPPAAAASA
jgi:hypothetical protein